MTKKDYVKFIELMKSLPISPPNGQIPMVKRSDLIVALCKLFHEDNARFNSNQFIVNCE